MQIADDARELGKYTGLSTVTLIGGADYAKQLSKVNDRVTDIVVATPGRLIDFIQRGDMFQIGSNHSFWTKLIVCLIWALFPKLSAS